MHSSLLGFLIVFSATISSCGASPLVHSPFSDASTHLPDAGTTTSNADTQAAVFDIPSPRPHSAALLACANISLPDQTHFTRPRLLDSDQNGTLDLLDTVAAPIPDGKPIYVPVEEYPDQPYVKCGLIDITKPPFHADSTGVYDATQPIREAASVFG